MTKSEIRKEIESYRRYISEYHMLIAEGEPVVFPPAEEARLEAEIERLEEMLK